METKKAFGNSQVRQAINENNEVLKNYVSIYGQTNVVKQKEKKKVVESRHQNIMKNMKGDYKPKTYKR